MLPTIRLNDKNDYVIVAEYLTGYAKKNKASGELCCNKSQFNLTFTVAMT